MSDTPSTPLAIVTAFLKAFEAMDFDAALAHLDATVEYTNVPLGTAIIRLPTVKE